MKWKLLYPLIIPIIVFNIHCMNTMGVQNVNDELIWKKDSLQESLYTITNLISKKNTKGVQEYIHPDLGLLVYYRQGIFENFIKYSKMPDEIIYPNYYPFKADSLINTFSYGRIPKYDCGENIWLKSGAFVDTNSEVSFLKESIELKEKVQGKKITNTMKNYILEIEKKGYQVVSTEVGDSGIVFWVLYIDNKIYLVLIDLVTTDCSS